MGPLQEHDDAPYVSTGHLPSPEQVRRSVDAAYERYRRGQVGVPPRRPVAVRGPGLALDGFGNSVKGQLAARFLSRRLG